MSRDLDRELYERERVYIKEVAANIRALTAFSTYDHRKYIDPIWVDGGIVHNIDAEVSQGKLLYAIGKVLKPVNVYEIGMGPGITAHSLVSACPSMHYFGVDNVTGTRFKSEFNLDAGVNATFDGVLDRLLPNGGSAGWLDLDSDRIEKFQHPFGRIDLIHVDGDHEFEHQRRDVEKAIASGAEWLLVDDCNDTEVVTACFAAWKNQWNKAWRGGLLPFIYFEDSRTGSLLFHSGMWGHLNDE